jgi:DNA-binding NtrC family response regulator
MVVSHVPAVQQVFASVLSQHGIAPILASNVKEAQAILSRHYVYLAFCSDELPEGGIGTLIKQTSRSHKRVPVVVVSRFDDWGRYLNFLEAGAFDYVLYPPSGIEIERVVKRAANLGTLAMAQGAA